MLWPRVYADARGSDLVRGLNFDPDHNRRGTACRAPTCFDFLIRVNPRLTFFFGVDADFHALQHLHIFVG
jgi:hypothetical protein